MQEEEIDNGEIYTDQFGGILIDELNEAFACRSYSSVRQ
jgi:hypothetical protein